MNNLRHWLEILIAALLIVGGVSLFFAEPVTAAGPVARLLGGTVAVYFYGVVFTVEGLTLLYAKARRRKKLHSKILLYIYLTMLFTIFLEWAITGLSWSIVDNVVATIASAFCWLRWKFTTEYLDPEAFYAATMDLRDDLPPKH